MFLDIDRVIPSSSEFQVQKGLSFLYPFAKVPPVNELCVQLFHFFNQSSCLLQLAGQ
jgi:hypothetical protein